MQKTNTMIAVVSPSSLPANRASRTRLIVRPLAWPTPPDTFSSSQPSPGITQRSVQHATTYIQYYQLSLPALRHDPRLKRELGTGFRSRPALPAWSWSLERRSFCCIGRLRWWHMPERVAKCRYVSRKHGVPHMNLPPAKVQQTAFPWKPEL